MLMGWVVAFMILLTAVSAAAIITVALVRPKEHRHAAKLSGYDMVECSYQTLSDHPTNRTYSTYSQQTHSLDITVQGTLKGVQSRNWAGYAVADDLTNPTPNSVQMVSASWTLPRIRPPNNPKNVNHYSAAWVGLDGFASKTMAPIVQQVGTASDWDGSKQIDYAWFKVAEKAPVMVVNFPLSPGDVVSAAIKTVGKTPGRLRMTLRNDTRGVAVVIPFDMTASPHAQCSTAQFAIEAPSEPSPSGSTRKILPLADFGTHSFHECLVMINRRLASINSNDGRQHAAISLVTNTDQPIFLKTIAAPSPLSPDGKSFSIVAQPL